MITFLTIIAGGLLARADGWGAALNAPLWQVKLAKFFNAWSCGGLFAMAVSIYSENLWFGLMSGLSFVLWRLPGFHGWEDWAEMAWRGFWPTAIGFSIIALFFGLPFYSAFLSVPMGAAMALAYSGSYKWLPKHIGYEWTHIVAEISSGMAFSLCVILVVLGL